MLDQLVQSGVMNNGQVCGAQSRILVSRKRYAEVVDALGSALGALKVGDPLDDATQIGPLVAERQRTRVEGYIDAGKAAGARVVVGGGRPADLPTGWYVEPTVFADVDNSMKIAQEEIFGPVLSVIPYDDEDNAVKIANDSDYGLCGSVWTSDPGARRADRGAHPHGCGRDQLVDDPRLQQPVRRVQEVGHRPRARPRGHRPLHRAPDDRPPRGLDGIAVSVQMRTVGTLCVFNAILCAVSARLVLRRRRRGRAARGDFWFGAGMLFGMAAHLACRHRVG